MPDSANGPRRKQKSEDYHRDTEADEVETSLLHRGQLVVLNEGSVARDYLGKAHICSKDLRTTLADPAMYNVLLAAYERNYLAWIKLVVSCLIISGGLIIRLHVRSPILQNRPP